MFRIRNKIKGPLARPWQGCAIALAALPQLPRTMKTISLVVLTFLFVFPWPAMSQQIGDQVRLESANATGVPVHLAAGDDSYVRWARAPPLQSSGYPLPYRS